MQTHITLFNKFLKVAAKSPPPLQREAQMAVHKMTYPMKDILDKVPGDSVMDKAKKLKVSRQTVYVWISERYRPTNSQAIRIAKASGVPIEHIIENGFEDEDTRRAARREIARLAANRKKTASRPRRTAPRRRRTDADQHRAIEA